jgi:hypothetical protein
MAAAVRLLEIAAAAMSHARPRARSAAHSCDRRIARRIGLWSHPEIDVEIVLVAALDARVLEEEVFLAIGL